MTFTELDTPEDQQTFVLRVLKKNFWNYHHLHEDLFQDGCVALVALLNRRDEIAMPSTKHFNLYAAKTVRNAMWMAFYKYMGYHEHKKARYRVVETNELPEDAFDFDEESVEADRLCDKITPHLSPEQQRYTLCWLAGSTASELADDFGMTINQEVVFRRNVVSMFRLYA